MYFGTIQGMDRTLCFFIVVMFCTLLARRLFSGLSPTPNAASRGEASVQVPVRRPCPAERFYERFYFLLTSVRVEPHCIVPPRISALSVGERTWRDLSILDFVPPREVRRSQHGSIFSRSNTQGSIFQRMSPHPRPPDERARTNAGASVYGIIC